MRLARGAGRGGDEVVQHLPQRRDIGLVDLVVERLAVGGNAGLQDGGHQLLHAPDGVEKRFSAKGGDCGNLGRRSLGKWAGAHFYDKIYKAVPACGAFTPSSACSEFDFFSWRDIY